MLSFKVFFATAAAGILTLFPVCIQAYPNPLPFTGDITTPLGSSPTMCKSGSTYFIFSKHPGIQTWTSSDIGLAAGGVGIPIYTSTDLKAWTHIGAVFPSGAPWTAPFTGGDNLRLWAPDCKIVDGAFRVRLSLFQLCPRH
jgi:arabinan endo-1,5-alpha-L-arabinosidase